MSDLADPRFLDERLAHWGEAKPDDEAITYLDRTWTWAQWNDRVRRLAGALTAFGVKRGDVVAFLDRYEKLAVEKGRKSEDARLAAWQSFCQTLLCRNEFLYIE